MKRKMLIVMFLSMVAISLGACSDGNEDYAEYKTSTEEMQTEQSLENAANENTAEVEEDTENAYIPSKETVLSMREIALEGMTEDEIERLTENIKIANLQMESGYLNDNLFEKLSDKDSVYWLYFDQKGEFQIGWWYNGNICSKESIMRMENISEEEFDQTYTEPGMVYNRFDAGNFIDLMKDMQATVHNESLSSDLQRLIDFT